MEKTRSFKKSSTILRIITISIEHMTYRLLSQQTKTKIQNIISNVLSWGNKVKWGVEWVEWWSCHCKSMSDVSQKWMPSSKFALPYVTSTETKSNSNNVISYQGYQMLTSYSNQLGDLLQLKATTLMQVKWDTCFHSHNQSLRTSLNGNTSLIHQQPLRYWISEQHLTPDGNSFQKISNGYCVDLRVANVLASNIRGWLLCQLIDCHTAKPPNPSRLGETAQQQQKNDMRHSSTIFKVATPSYPFSATMTTINNPSTGNYDWILLEVLKHASFTLNGSQVLHWTQLMIYLLDSTGRVGLVTTQSRSTAVH